MGYMMKSFDVVGYVIGCEVYCTHCTPETEGDEVYPYFVDDAIQGDASCDECHCKLVD